MSKKESRSHLLVEKLNGDRSIDIRGLARTDRPPAGRNASLDGRFCETKRSNQNVRHTKTALIWAPCYLESKGLKPNYRPDFI